MATQTMNLVCDNSSDANFIGWAKAICDRMVGFGWTQTNDTGQVNWATAVKPAAANTYPAFAIFAPADALQATSPFFVKLEFGSGSNQLYPSVAVTIGTGTGGAGALSGTVTARQIFSAAQNIATPQVCKFSGANNRFACSMWPEFSGGATFLNLGFERTHDATGADTDLGMCALGVSTAIKNLWLCPKAGLGAAPPVETSIPSIGPTTANSTRGTDFGIYYITPFFGRQLLPLRNFATYFGTEITANVNITAEMFSVAAPLYTIGGSTTGFMRGLAADAAVVQSRLAMRWE